MSCGASGVPEQLLLASATAGESEWLEVLEGSWDIDAGRPGAKGCVVGWKGQRLRISMDGEGDFRDDGGGIRLERVGFYPLDDGPLCATFPELREKLEACHTHAGDDDTPPWKVSFLEEACTLQELTRAVGADPNLWNDGTEPGPAALSRLELATATAGELLSVMQGTRGVCVVQLWNGWDTSEQYLYSPYAMRMLTRALATPGIKVCLSAAPNKDNPVALSAIVYADKEPWSKWGPHLATFGFQDKLVGGSAYYKLLCGLILGYKEDNVRSYVVNTCPPNALTRAVESKVVADMRKLSKAKPKLPWNATGGSRGKRHKAPL